MRRVELGIDFEKFAEAVGMTPSDLEEFEIGEVCKPQFIEAIADELEWSIEEYLTEADKLSPDSGTSSSRQPRNAGRA
jgi:hypothetical protein